MKVLSVLPFLLVLACAAGPITGPAPLPEAPDLASDYCHPCCKAGESCAIPCVDCLQEACAVRADGQKCCTSNRVPPDGGSLCPWPPADLAASCSPGVDYQSDVSNCGSCGMVCPLQINGTRECVKGSCAAACNAPWFSCGVGPIVHCSTDTSMDNANCGGCGHICVAPSTCRAGSCT